MSMRTRAGKKISLTNYEELLAVPIIEGASDIPLDQLHEFKGHPFHVVDDEAMDELGESMRKSFEESKEKQKSGDGKEQTEPSAGRDGWQEAKDTPFR